ncbi:hypothetical protein HQ560_06870, partial [bacterium]|nr:hypothetical protein [bacterium]
YVQASNTGTKFTSDWRERVGFVHNQLTNNDDIFTLDYITASLDAADAVVASYERPWFGSDWLRWRTVASWYEYTASDVGAAASEFDGEGWDVRADLIANIYQRGAFFLDLILGATYEHNEVTDTLLAVTGEEDFLILNGGARFERLAETSSLWGSAMVEWQGGWTDPDLLEMTELGRFDPSEEWALLKYDFYWSFYLEPLLFPKAWADPETPASSTLAHEMMFSLRGQDSCNNRLIPQHEAVLGGLYTVRGYPEAVVAGDTMYVATGEYRFHLPRIFKPVSAFTEAEREKLKTKLPMVSAPFRYRPDNVYGQPDWDLILRIFYDVGRTTSERMKPYETNTTLSGAGFGLELRIKSNVSLRADYGVALDDVEHGSEAVESGDNRVHGVITISF